MRFARSLLLATALFFVPPAASALADDWKPDDTVTNSFTVEGDVVTQTARVVVSVEAAMAGVDASKARGAMQSAVQGLADGKWRLTTFNRSTDSTGLERWYAQYEARLPEASLGGLADRAKAASKAGMQLSIATMDFTPTLAETEAVRGALRQQVYAQAVAELGRLNAALPGRNFRIAGIMFSENGAPPMMAPMMLKAARADMATMEASPPAEVSQRISVTASATYAALAPTEIETPKTKTVPATQ